MNDFSLAQIGTPQTLKNSSENDGRVHREISDPRLDGDKECLKES
jgi:hypothetical protein